LSLGEIEVRPEQLVIEGGGKEQRICLPGIPFEKPTAFAPTLNGPNEERIEGSFDRNLDDGQIFFFCVLLDPPRATRGERWLLVFVNGDEDYIAMVEDNRTCLGIVGQSKLGFVTGLVVAVELQDAVGGLNQLVELRQCGWYVAAFAFCAPFLYRQYQAPPAQSGCGLAGFHDVDGDQGLSVRVSLNVVAEGGATPRQYNVQLVSAGEGKKCRHLIEARSKLTEKPQLCGLPRRVVQKNSLMKSRVRGFLGVLL
jgi:hypothetical protein